MSETTWLPIVTNLEFTLDRNTYSDQQWENITASEADQMEIKLASFAFSDLKFDCFQQNCSTQSTKVKQLAQVLKAYQSSKQTFTSISIIQKSSYGRLSFGSKYLNQRCYQPNFIINRAFLNSLKNISSVVQFSLQGNPEEKLKDKWVRWGSDYNLKPITVNISQMQGTTSNAGTCTYPLEINCTKELNLLCEGKSNFRLRFNLDVSMEVSAKDLRGPRVVPLRFSPSLILAKLCSNDATKDFMIIAAEGDKIPCHGILLSALSPVFEAMISSKMQEGETRVLKLEDISKEALTHFIGYFYGVEIPIEISSDVAVQLFQAGHKYKIKSLEQAMASFFLYKEESWYTVDTSLELFFFTRNLDEYSDLNKHVLNIITRIPSSQLRSSDAFNELKPADALDLTLKLNDAWQLSTQN